MKYFILAGEASGDLHASNLMRALKKEDAEAVFVGLGGDKMREEGCRLLQDYRNMAFMGVIAVLANLRRYDRIFVLPSKACWTRNRMCWCSSTTHLLISR